MPGPSERASAQYRLLVIDDEPFVGRIVQRQFERGPFRVSVAFDGASGLAFLRENADVACVLLDINMPGMNGIDVLREVHGDAALSGIPVLVLSGAGDVRLMESARELGISAFVAKPFSPKKLYRQVAEIVGAGTLDPEEGG